MQPLIIKKNGRMSFRDPPTSRVSVPVLCLGLECRYDKQLFDEAPAPPLEHGDSSYSSALLITLLPCEKSS
jgi:hypothetical protein